MILEMKKLLVATRLIQWLEPIISLIHFAINAMEFMEVLGFGKKKKK